MTLGWGEGAVSREDVIWAYRMILGRDPESDAAIAAHMDWSTISDLRHALITSPEFRQGVGLARRYDSDPRDRIDRIRDFVTKEQLGIEIGAWFNPLCPKADGYNALVLDVFDQAELKARATADPGISAEQVERIEPVDFIGSVTGLAEMVDAKGLSGSIDYVISSHNFEHIPDPIRFLQDCAKVLKPGGMVSMAIPDRRTCFDHFRPHTTTGEMLEAFWEQRTKPSAAQIYTHVALHAKNHVDNVALGGWSLDLNPSHVELQDNILNAYDIAKTHLSDDDAPYFDAHCWSFTPTSFETIMIDLRALGLVSLTVRDISAFGGHEFYVHLSRTSESLPDAASDSFRKERSELLLRVNDEAAEHSRLAYLN